MASTVYSSCPLPFTTGCFLYTDSGLTTPVANGIYSDGTNTYTVSGGAGEITSTGLCPFTNLIFDLITGAGGYTIGGIDVNGVTPTLTGGYDVPFFTDTHEYHTDQIGTSQTLNIFVSALSLNGCITVTDSASNVFQQNINATGTYSFSGLTIDNITAVNVLCADNVC